MKKKFLLIAFFLTIIAVLLGVLFVDSDFFFWRTPEDPDARETDESSTIVKLTLVFEKQDLHESILFSVACSPDGESILTGGGFPPQVGIWQAINGAMTGDLRGHSDSVTHVDVASDGSFIASGGMDGKVILWNYSTGEIAKIWEVNGTVENDRHFISSLAFSDDGDMLAFSGTDQKIRVVFLSELDVVYVIDSFDGKHPLGEIFVAFSPDDQFLAIGSYSGELKILALPDFQLVERLSFGHDMNRDHYGFGVLANLMIEVMVQQNSIGVWDDFWMTIREGIFPLFCII